MVQNSVVGTPQGSIISPLLANIYLHPLDSFIEEKIQEYNKGKQAKVSNAYKKLEYLFNKALKLGDKKEARRIYILRRSIPSRLPADPNFRRMYYIRYADD